jgi:ubiquinone/menaquinone biosynthesis C-methylase UbiE
MDSKENAAYWEANAEAWTQLVRAGYDVYRDGQNTPAFLAMLPPVAGLLGLDIGCGEGQNTRGLARLGARMRAIDIAPTFIRHAQAAEEEEPLGIDYQVGDGLALPFADACFDFATAFMSLMDMPNHPRVLAEIRRVLRPRGFIQASILHPCFCPLYRKTLREPDGTVRAIEVARYFDEAPGEVETWCFSSIPKEQRQQYRPFQIPRFHRTLSGWMNLLHATGLVLEELGEPRASDDAVRAYPNLDDTQVVPLFLHFRARKPAGN